MDFAGAFIGRKFVEHFELLTGKERFRGHFDGRVVAFQMMIEPAEDRYLKFLSVFVRSGCDNERQVFRLFVEIVDVRDFFV